MKIYIYVNLKTYTQLDDQPLILSSKMSCQRSMSGFLDLSSFLSARTQQMGGYQKLYSNRTDPYSPNVQSFGGCLKQSEPRSSWSYHPTARSGERKDGAP